MAINWSHLPKEVVNAICMCIGKDKQDGYSEDQESGYWVHAGKTGCRKPSVLTSVIECDECGKAFVPVKQKTIKMSFLGAMCPECEEEF